MEKGCKRSELANLLDPKHVTELPADCKRAPSCKTEVRVRGRAGTAAGNASKGGREGGGGGNLGPCQ